MAHWRGGGIVRDKYDRLFSDLVRERADWFCENCRKNFRHDPHGLHCSHLFGRGMKGLRLHKHNAFAHCQDCHEHFEQHPVLFAEWARQKLGDALYNVMRVLAGKPTKFTDYERELLHKHYLKEKKRLLQLRLAGMFGRIEFTMLGDTAEAA